MSKPVAIPDLEADVSVVNVVSEFLKWHCENEYENDNKGK